MLICGEDGDKGANLGGTGDRCGSGIDFLQRACVCGVSAHAMTTLPNILTFSRLPAMFAIVALMNADFHWAATIAFWLFIAAALTDWLDGKLARESNQVSTFGRFMDAVIDKVMVLGIMIAFVAGNGYFMGYKITGMILLLCILGREFMVSGLRMVAATKGTVIEADAGGKVKTFIQLNAIGWLLGRGCSRRISATFSEAMRAGR